MPDILLVEDKHSLRRMLCLTLEAANHTVTAVGDCAEAVSQLERVPFRLVVTDLRMPNGSGLDVLRAARAVDPAMPVILMTAYGSIDEAVQAMKDGAYDFLQKPVDSRHLLLVVERALETVRLRTVNIMLQEEAATRYGFPRIVGDSPELARACKQIQQVAPRSATVLLLGESGTGKELFARALHQLSSRAQAPFVAVNCAAIPETLIENELFGHERGAYTGADTRRPGRFELAHRGTLFLDEVGELPLPVQAKLLRALEDGRITRLGGQGEVDVDVRVVAATNRDLQQAVFRREFREDLYFRLAVFPVRIPPLRERRSDIADLALHFVGRAGPEIRGRSVGISAEALALLERYDWPGNVRELENCIERACIIAEGDIIGPQDLDLRAVAGAATECDPLQQFDLSGTLAEAVARVQRQIEERKISQALRACEGSRGRAAEMLGITAKTLLAKMRELGMEESK